VKVFWDEKRIRKKLPNFIKNEGDSRLLADFLGEIWDILTIFMSSKNTFTASLAPPRVFGISRIRQTV